MSSVDRNPWLIRMFAVGVLAGLSGLAVALAHEEQPPCILDGGGDCGPQFITITQVFGFGLMAFGGLALIAGMVTAAICWQFGRRDDDRP